ncbi:MAG: hypothetical protein C5B55_06080, partial [Blastocatellia bacterium]
MLRRVGMSEVGKHLNGTLKSAMMALMTIDKVAALKRTVLFGDLDEENLRALATRAFERSFNKDEVVFVAGEEARGLYVIVKGAVRAFRISSDGREQVIHV